MSETVTYMEEVHYWIKRPFWKFKVVCKEAGSKVQKKLSWDISSWLLFIYIYILTLTEKISDQLNNDWWVYEHYSKKILTWADLDLFKFGSPHVLFEWSDEVWVEVPDKQPT